MNKTELPKNPTLNGKYEFLQKLGEGNTSKVYLASMPTGHYVAVKLLSEKFLQSHKDAAQTVINEVVILQKLQHPKILQIYDFGQEGVIVKPSGSKLTNQVYIVLEFVSGGLLFDVCQSLGGLGEDCSRYFFR